MLEIEKRLQSALATEMYEDMIEHQMAQRA